MSKHRKTNRTVSPVLGVILPDAVYTTDACMTQCGIGYDQLLEARKAGAIKPYGTKKQIYYYGRELIAWVMREVK